ncbi:MFS transporter [Patescibacteria group bacterium]|nr:MFS transporter [Patescibacteria group bacterium]MBU1500742.1 MFS transporter [Patescibacteria group bacterium]MBU2080797.1 MFS transporter [Patescibacteria group bacterium]MBU2123902.1 MFS transporter [Patescibacteria group bacterium]MBU2194807.1 MFS transporter [Patescibacteria group bacterium]
MGPRLALSIGNFFAAGHFFLVAYIIAPYLALYMPAAQTGLVVSLGAVFTLSLFPFMPRITAHFGARKMAIALTSLQAIILGSLAISPGVIPAVIFIAAACATAPFISYQLDLLLEATVREENTTGRVRTLFLTAANIALVLAPLIIGFLLGSTENYARVFFASALMLTPFITLFLFERTPEPQPHGITRVGLTCKCIWADKDLRAASIGNAVLQFFYHLAPLYTSLYLHTALGIPWSELGWIFAIMLIPFVFIEYPAGYIADRWLGDKELLITGFVITGVFFALLGFVTIETPLLLIAAILFMTRVGAALVEAMVEGHFFRRVSERDANTISVFRMTRPLAGLTAPLFASIVLLSGNYLAFFILSGGIIVALGVVSAAAIHDIR